MSTCALAVMQCNNAMAIAILCLCFSLCSLGGREDFFSTTCEGHLAYVISLSNIGHNRDRQIDNR